ncbi:uncharacterized protein LOC106159337 [Lingula anatina]|uniref:Uncharacterized protein LOC106159337 n=1 Tax=Lingula anatina TaxID=7574 RepID=A0A1S3HYG4_LINAN|nr:uncharacterized protein LOC106159337 [Lingula anatina]|eukprot:XP_013391053.1 uncharacterized protein LOC106159337 [Lingula anatina]
MRSGIVAVAVLLCLWYGVDARLFNRHECKWEFHMDKTYRPPRKMPLCCREVGNCICTSPDLFAFPSDRPFPRCRIGQDKKIEVVQHCDKMWAGDGFCCLKTDDCECLKNVQRICGIAAERISGPETATADPGQTTTDGNGVEVLGVTNIKPPTLPNGVPDIFKKRAKDCVITVIFYGNRTGLCCQKHAFCECKKTKKGRMAICNGYLDFL